MVTLGLAVTAYDAAVNSEACAAEADAIGPAAQGSTSSNETTS